MYEKLENYEGLSRLRTLLGTNRSCGIEDLNEMEIQTLRSLNEKLQDYEAFMKMEAEHLMHGICSYRDRCEEKVSLIAEISFFLSEESEAYDENECNLLTVLTETKHYPLQWEWGFGDEKCHNTIPNRVGTPFEKDKHCATFHALYDHTDLTWKEILEIGSFSMRFSLELNYDAICRRRTSMETSECIWTLCGDHFDNRLGEYLDIWVIDDEDKYSEDG